MNKIICLWSCPRNVSTALMYSFAQRLDTSIFDEPLYAHYLKNTGLNHPAREQVLDAQENDGEKVVKQIILKKRDKISFHKLMTHFLINIDLDFFLSQVNNIIFIRDPKEIIVSYSKVIPNPSMKDIGIEQQYELYQHLIKVGKSPIILDSKYLLKNPKEILQELCLLLAIDFDEKMLQWEKEQEKKMEYGRNIGMPKFHNSTGFFPYEEKQIDLKNPDIELYEECLPYYEFLTAKSIKI